MYQDYLTQNKLLLPKVGGNFVSPKNGELTLCKDHKFDNSGLMPEDYMSPARLKHLHDCIHFSQGNMSSELERRMEKCLKLD